MMSDVQVTSKRSENNGLVFDVGLSDEDWEILQELNQSRGWRLYRQILLSMKEGHQIAMYPMKDSSEVLKSLGIVVGLNLSVNQLGAMMAQLKQIRDRRVAGESKNQQQPKL